MKIIKGDLIQGNWDVACHCANVHEVMGSGVALALRKKWPEVYASDVEFGKEYRGNEKLGSYSIANVPLNRLVFNLYGQVGIGNDGTPLDRNCSYDHLYNALYKMCVFLEDDSLLFPTTTIGVPKYMGCCRAGGSWIIVEAMLKDLESKFDVDFHIYELENAELTAQSSVKH